MFLKEYCLQWESPYSRIPKFVVFIILCDNLIRCTFFVYVNITFSKYIFVTISAKKNLNFDTKIFLKKTMTRMNIDRSFQKPK